MKKVNTSNLARAALIAAVYCVLTICLPMLSYGMVQIRFAEMLTVLPCYTAAAIPGLFIGCVLANLIGISMGVAGIADVFVGSLATLVAAFLTHKLRKKKAIALMPPVLVNAVVIGIELTLVSETPFYINALCVGAGELIACYVIGYTVSIIFDKNLNRMF